MSDLAALDGAAVRADASGVRVIAVDPWPGLACGFHHIGYACPVLEREAAAFLALGYRPAQSFVDPGQGVRGLFMDGPLGAPRIELLQNLPGARTLTPWIERGVRMYHLAEVVADLEAAIGAALERGARLLAPPVPAPGFGGRRIVFTVARSGPLLELIEQHRPTKPESRDCICT